MGPTILQFLYVVARWHWCLRWCGRSATRRNSCFSPVAEPTWEASFPLNVVSLHPTWKEDIPREQKGYWWTEAVASQGFSFLPSPDPHNWKRGPLVGRAWWIIFSCSKNHVSPKINVGFLMPTDRDLMWLLQCTCCLLQGCFSSYSAQPAFLGLERNLQKWWTRYSSCLSNI